MSIKTRKFLRCSSALLSTFLLSVIFLWPLRTISPIADDLHLIAQGSGIMRQNGLWHVMDIWSDFSLTSAHLTPLGGIWTAFYVWITNQLALRTPLTLVSAWGILRVLSIAFAIQSVLHLGRTITRRMALPETFNLILFLVLLATIQVHGYWSNDPVVSFPVASWAFCIIGFYFLSFLIRSTNSEIWSEKYYIYGTLILAVLGILTYELFLAFLVAGFFLIIWKVLHARTYRSLDFSILVGAIIIPALLLVVGQLLRLSSGSSYSGTEISIQVNSLPKIFFIAAVSSLPFANYNLTQQLLSNGAIVSTHFWFSLMILVLLTGAIIKRTRYSVIPSSRGFTLSLILALVSLWLTATAVITVTPKYQAELNGILGKVYINYAPSWLAISILISIGIVLIVNRQSVLITFTVLLLLPTLGGWQLANNLRQVSTLATDTEWSRPLFTLLESSIQQNPQRCLEIDVLFGMPLPEYYQTEIYSGLQDSYGGTYGVPYCDFENLGERSPISVRNVAGLFRVEFQADGKVFFWSNSEFAAVDVVYRGTKKFNGQLVLQIDPTPCLSTHGLEIAIGGQSPIKAEISKEPILASQSVTLSPGEVTKVEIKQSGTPCTIPTEDRKSVV
jgi:hypothetical protein